MGRRSHARRLNLRTRLDRDEGIEEFNVREWLLKPEQKATREEVYTLLRQYDWEYRRWKAKRRGWVGRYCIAVWLVLSAPVRIPFRLLHDRWERWRRKDDVHLAKQLRIRARELGVELDEVLEEHSARNLPEEEPDGA